MTLTPDDLLAVVRVHADRVHDAVRRLGCSPAVALEVVTESALDLVAVADRDPAAAGDPVGWWFARAWDLGQPAAGDSPDLPLGGGLLSADQDQVVLAEVLEELPERDRMALLLRDSYALAEVSLGAALDLTGEAAMALVGRARLALLEACEGDVPHDVGSHQLDLPALVRLAEGGQLAARDATTRRHVQSCASCQSTVDALERAHLLLAGLTVVALPEAERQDLLTQVETAAVVALARPPAATPDEDDDLPRRLLSPLVALLLLGLAVLVGLGSGVLLSRTGSVGSHPLEALPAQANPGDRAPPEVAVNVQPPRSPDPLPSLTVFTVAPSPLAEPSPTAPASPSAAPRPTGSATTPLRLVVEPGSGPGGATLTVRGTGWPAQQTVRLDYLDPFGRVGTSVLTTADARGAFTAMLRAEDPSGLPGRHTVRATGGGLVATAPYDVTSAR